MLLAVVSTGCARDNPAYDDLADESGSDGDGDGDPGDGDGDPGDGDGDPGDGDGEPGDGDGEPGDGDGEPGDGDGEPGDGDGDGDDLLPQCPESVEVALPLMKDTFLVASPEDAGKCVVSWNFDLWQPILSDSLLPCEQLAFGGASFHWICSADGCSSVWLGRFDVGGWADQEPKVLEASLEYTAKIDNPEPNQVSVFPLLDNDIFDVCGDWKEGSGWGEAPDQCVSTWTHAAYPAIWNVDAVLGNASAIGSAQVPAGELFVHEGVIPISTSVTQHWLDGSELHLGLFMRSQGLQPTHLMLEAKESESPPVLVVELCSEL